MTYQKDQFERETKKFDIIVNLLQKCSSNNVSDREFANRYIGASKSISIAVFNDYFANDPKFDNAMSHCMNIVQNTEANITSQSAIVAPPPDKLPPSARDGSSGETATAATGSTTPSAPPNDGPRFWIYLGTYKDNAWKTRYINIPDDFNPAKFKPETDKNKGIYQVHSQTGALNVRYGEFGPFGGFPPPTSSPLRTGQKVELRSTAQWFDSGDWWATIAPPPTTASR
jgi:hypothetical protein